MKVGRLFAGFCASAMVCIFSVVVTIMSINSELIMFDRYDQNKLIITLLCPGIVQAVIYIIWFVLKARGDSRDTNKLAKNSLLFCAVSFAISVLLLFGMASLFSLWGDGNIFLVAAAVLYAIAGLIQYMLCRPY